LELAVEAKDRAGQEQKGDEDNPVEDALNGYGA
jgi:hypothetical protein